MKAGPIDWNNIEYHEDRTALSNSKRELYRTNARTFGRWIDGLYTPPDPSREMVLGSALHAYVLEPDWFRENVAIVPADCGPCQAQTKQGKPCSNPAKPNGFCGRHGGEDPDAEIVLSSDEGQLVESMANQIQQHQAAATMLQRASHREQAFVWQDPDTGLLLKCKPDILHRMESPRFVADIKTTRATTQHGYRTAIMDRGYHRQAAFYLTILRGLGIATKDTEWYFVFVTNKTDPYCHVVRLGEQTLQLGFTQVRRDLAEIADRLNSGNWQQAGLDQIVTLDLPPYAFYEE